MAETGSAIFRAIADWAQLRREARRASKDLKDTRGRVQDLDESLGDLDQSGDTAGRRLRKVGDDAKAADKDVKGLLGSVQQWARVRATATLGLDVRRAKADIRQIKDDLAGMRVTRLELDAQTARAKQELGDVQGELTRLRTQPTSAKVDADTASAVARIAQLKTHIAGLRTARLRVDADTAKARAQIAALSRDADALGRKRPTVKVGVDSSKVRLLAVALGAVTAAAALIGPVVGVIAALAGGLFAVASAAAPAVGGLAGVAAMAGAVAQAAAAAAIALSGVGKAVKALQAKQDAAGGAAVNSAKQQQAAAERVAAAQRGVDRAIEQRSRTAEQGRQSIEAAERAVVSAVESSARRIASAERSHADAVRDVARARADLNRELADAKERMEDLALQVEDGQLDEEAAVLRVRRVEEDLARVRRLGGSGTELAEADLAHRQALHNLKSIQEGNKDLAEQQKQSAQAGVEGDEQVIAAHERLADAQQAVRDAEDELAQARKDGRAEVADAERQLSQTIQQAAWANADAQQAVTDATRELAVAYRDAGVAAESGGAGRAADDFDKASPAAQRFARFLNDEVLPALRRVRDEIQARALPKFETAIRTALPLLGLFGDRLGVTADIIGDLSIEAARMMTSGPWTRDFGTILDSNNRIIQTLGTTGLAAMDALRHLWVTSGPLAERLSNLVLRGTETARAFLEAKRGTGELDAFMTKAGNTIEQMFRILGNLLGIIWNVGRAAAPAGQLLLDSFERATQKLQDLTGSVEGQNAIRDWFLAIVPVVTEIARLVNDLFMWMVRLGSDPATAQFVQQLRTELLPALDKMIAALGENVIPLLIDFAAKVANIMAELGGGGLVGFLLVLNGVATALEWILSIPGVGEFVGFILALAGAGMGLSATATGIGLVTDGLRKLGPAIDIVKWAVAGLGTVMRTHPILAILTAVALIAILIIENWDTLKAWWEAFWPWAKNAAQVFWDWLTWIFGGEAAQEQWDKFLAAIKAKLSEWVDWGKQKWTEFWDWLWGKSDESSISIGDRLSRFGEDLKATFTDAWATATRIVSDGWTLITGTSEEKAAVVRGILQDVGDAVGIDLVGAWDRAVRGVSGFIDTMQRRIQDLVAFIERQIQRAQAALDRLGSSVSSGLSSAARYVIPGYATGGLVGGRGNGDNQIIRATAGEWVVPKDVTRRFLPFLRAITFGSLRSVTQIVQPAQARLIQDRLAGVPDLSELAGLRELMTSTRGASTTSIDNSDNSNGPTIVTNIYNPIATPASDSVADRMRTLSLMGAFS